MSTKRTCKGICQRFTVTKPYGIGRYNAGQGHCQVCEVWVDYRGCHTKEGSPATSDSIGWFCNCCNFRIRRNPRSAQYKAKRRLSNSEERTNSVDLSYFNKLRAHMLRELSRAIIKKEVQNDSRDHRFFLPSTAVYADIEHEFNTSIDSLVDLAKTTDPPNKASMILEFERVRHILKRTPTEMDIEKKSPLHISQYKEEFGTWEHMLERLGYDPWYRQKNKMINADRDGSLQDDYNDLESKNLTKTLDDARKTIIDTLKDEPEMLELFAMVERNIPKLNSNEIEELMSCVDHD